MGRHCKQSTPDQFAEKTLSSQRFNPRDPEMEMLLRGLLHELRNPLSSILTASTLLQDSPLPDEVEMSDESRMLLEVVKKESLRLNHILTEFAGYIKLPPPQPSQFDLAQAARAAVRELQREGVLRPGIAIKDELPPTCPVWADENQVRIALSHILRNSVEAMPDGGELRLSYKSPGFDNAGSAEKSDDAIICISDSGKGFTPESRDRAFQPFYSSKEHSVGLGLSSVRSLIEASDGFIWLEENEPLENHSPTTATPSQPSTLGASQTTSAMSICFQLPRPRTENKS